MPRVTHFALDTDYLSLLVEVIANELERLLSFASNCHEDKHPNNVIIQ
jgi:hypothetical protein